MEIQKAIEILTHSLPADTWLLKPPSKDAIKLGIEALKTIERMREGNAFLSPRPLPGETEE